MTQNILIILSTNSFQRLGLLCCLLFYFNLALAQKTYHLQIIPLDKKADFIEKNVAIPFEYADSISLIQGMKLALGQLQERAYLEASFDSFALQKYLGGPFMKCFKKVFFVSLKILHGNL